jgi:2-amino-4-hydroxy-6-hydroxymethyldihydropteridine diphosphokinase
MADVIIALGSNLGDRLQMLRKAAAFLQELSTTPISVSSAYETDPVGASTQRYLNAVARVSTELRPGALLGYLKDWEVAQGRDPDAGRWTDRLIDLDIIDYDRRYVEEAELVVPHPECTKRRFVMQPLSEIAPDWVHPTEGLRIDDILAELPETGIRKGAAFW